MTFGVLIAMAWFVAVAAVLVWQYLGGAFARMEQERETVPALLIEPVEMTAEPVFALATRYKRAKTPACARRRPSAA